MLQKDYIKEEIIKRLNNKENTIDISHEIGVDILIVTSFEIKLETGENFGDTLTPQDIKFFYLEGLTFSEIGYLKGITKAGIRVAFDKFVGKDKERLKEINKSVRREIGNNILKSKVTKMIEEYGETDVYERLGYTKTYYEYLKRNVLKGETV